MSRYWKAALPFLLAAVIILAAASRPVVLHIGFPCDSYWNVPGENYYTFIDAAIEKFEAEHPNVKVEYTSGIRVEDYTEWLSGQYLLGQEPDVMVILPEDLVIFSDTASLRELDPFMKQDPEVDLSGFYPVHPGDTILIEGGMPHAIGAGCFLVEIQEPTDYTIRVERTTPSGFAVADSMCHQGLGFEKMFECFHYEPHSREEIHDRWFIEPETVLKTAGGSITTLVGYRNTPLFRLDEVNVSDTLTVDCPPRGSGIYVLEGAGTLSANGRSLPLKKTDQLFVPAGTGRFTLDAEAPLRVLHFFGPEQKQ